MKDVAAPKNVDASDTIQTASASLRQAPGAVREQPVLGIWPRSFLPRAADVALMFALIWPKPFCHWVSVVTSRQVRQSNPNKG